jgi:uncharacterized protein
MQTLSWVSTYKRAGGAIGDAAAHRRRNGGRTLHAVDHEGDEQDANRSGDEDELAVTLRIDEGFHINANPASLPYLIPTSLSFEGIAPLRIAYPAAFRFKPDFTDEPLDVYQGTVVITAFLPKDALKQLPALHASVTVQACTDAICLPPADLAIRE